MQLHLISNISLLNRIFDFKIMFFFLHKVLSHETTTFDEIPLAEVSNKWNCFDSVNKKLFELVSKQILLQFLVTIYQWNWFFSKNRSNRMMLSVWFLVFWQINHVKFNNKECAKKGFIFSLYSPGDLWKCRSWTFIETHHEWILIFS